jgi:hypothetical protein
MGNQILIRLILARQTPTSAQANLTQVTWTLSQLVLTPLALARLKTPQSKQSKLSNGLLELTRIQQSLARQRA